MLRVAHQAYHEHELVNSPPDWHDGVRIDQPISPKRGDVRFELAAHGASKSGPNQLPTKNAMQFPHRPQTITSNQHQRISLAADGKTFYLIEQDLKLRERHTGKSALQPPACAA
jgi:hypothetical protein